MDKGASGRSQERGASYVLTSSSGLCLLLGLACCQGNRSTWPRGASVGPSMFRRGQGFQEGACPVFLQTFPPPTHPQGPGAHRSVRTLAVKLR